LKGLPAEYKTFSAFVSKSDEKDDKLKFQEFKTALRSYEETEKSCTPQQSGEDSVMTRKQKSPPAKSSIAWYSCGQPGHRSVQGQEEERKQPMV